MADNLSQPLLGHPLGPPADDGCLPCLPMVSDCWPFATRSGLPNVAQMRVEPKVFFANERTFLSWLHMAVTLGGIGSAILGVSSAASASAPPGGAMIFGFRPTQLVGLILLPTAVLFVAYAVWVFTWRAEKIRKREDYNYDDRVGPLVLGSAMSLALAVIFGIALADVLSRMSK